MTERTNRRIVGQHLTYFFLRKSRHLVKLGAQGIVGADVEATGQIIHRHRTDTCYENTLQGCTCSRLHRIKEETQIAFAMRLLAIDRFADQLYHTPDRYIAIGRYTLPAYSFPP